MCVHVVCACMCVYVCIWYVVCVRGMCVYVFLCVCVCVCVPSLMWVCNVSWSAGRRPACLTCNCVNFYVNLQFQQPLKITFPFLQYIATQWLHCFLVLVAAFLAWQQCLLAICLAQYSFLHTIHCMCCMYITTQLGGNCIHCSYTQAHIYTLEDRVHSATNLTVPCSLQYHLCICTCTTSKNLQSIKH